MEGEKRKKNQLLNQLLIQILPINQESEKEIENKTKNVRKINFYQLLTN